MLNSPLAFAPINESAVVFLFGAVARQMGFLVTRIQTEFPDCEALRQVDRDRWQLKRIEFEYESRADSVHFGWRPGTDNRHTRFSAAHGRIV